MKKRLRKKLRLKEFKELGFTITASLELANEAVQEEMLDKILAKAEELDLICGGDVTQDDLDFIVSTGFVSEDNEARRAEFCKFVEALAEVKSIEASELHDVNCCHCH